jgi:hypothetical protein
VLPLKQAQLLDAAVDVVSGIIPRIGGVVLLDIGPGVRKVSVSALALAWAGFHISPWFGLHFASLWPDIGECVENMGQFLRGEILGVVVAAIDGLSIVSERYIYW